MSIAIGQVVYSSVTKFVLQPQKTKKKSKRDALDSLTEVWVGPAGGEDSFIPAIGTTHSSYNLMTLINATTKQMPGLVVEVSLDYHGKLYSSPNGRYTSVPTISRHWADSEITYQQGYYTYALRYTGRCVQISYITNNTPSGNETNLGLAKEFLGFTNQWTQIVSINPGGGRASSESPVQRMTCTDVKIDDSANGWFKVTETYQSKMFPGTVTNSDGGSSMTPPGKQTGSMFLGFKDLNSLPNLYGPDGLPNLFASDTATSKRTQGAAQSYAQDTNQSLNNAPPPPDPKVNVPVTVDTSTTLATGLDPNWGNTSGATSVASNSTGTMDYGPEAGSVSQLLDM
jgi:hypothetical protein